MSKATLKMTEGKAVFKLYGTIDDTITLATDCLASTEELIPESDQTVNILSLHWSGTAEIGRAHV